jgi:hypothetical protein
LGDLNLSDEYRSEVWKELNVAINYSKKLIHVYRVKHVVYEEGFEKYKENDDLIGNWWLPHYIVGATQTQTETERVRRTTTEPTPIETHHSSYDDGPEESASQAIANRRRDATDPRRPD